MFCIYGIGKCQGRRAFPTDVEEVYLGDNGILNHAGNRTVVIDMTTSIPDLAVKIY
nr:NAD(P)-binding domain-containing protein [Desulfobacula sp.]